MVLKNQFNSLAQTVLGLLNGFSLPIGAGNLRADGLIVPLWRGFYYCCEFCFHFNYHNMILTSGAPPVRVKPVVELNLLFCFLNYFLFLQRTLATKILTEKLKMSRNNI
ncbi:MAG: hypothetical protein A2277_02570 [Desulfobacterales bacterium RIFOXYA12_FULL_46_15]|nr:MAG: hypothetical protein A2277_02570 [Desulfobacterales bacterium RIFOXYA12_FULL_46_15]